MTKKKTDVSEWIPAHVAAAILTAKHGRKIEPGYVNRIKSITRFPVHETLNLYLKSDVEQVQLRAKNGTKQSNPETANAESTTSTPIT